MSSAFRLSDVYLDTAFVVNALFGHESGESASARGLAELVSSGGTAYFSEILRVEYFQALRRLATRGRVSTSTLDSFSLQRWNEAEVRRRWLRLGHKELDRFISHLPESVEIPLNRQIIEESVDLMATYALGSLDAVHLATALHYQIPFVWTCDDHFERVDDPFVEIIRDAD